MNMKQYMRNLLVAAVVGASLWTPRAVPALEDNGGYVISEVVARQRWPWERKVDIDFQLAKPEWAPPDRVVRIGVAASNDTREVAVSRASLAGTAVLPGNCRRIVWDPTLDHPNKSFPELKFYLSVIATNVAPEYMVVDLASGEVEYKDEYFADEVNADPYKTEKMAFRHIEPGTFTMGEGTGKETTLTKGFYIGVFEVTQEQWRYVTGGYPGSRFTAAREMRPAETVSYNDIRGTSAGTNWPAGSEVDDTSFLGMLRNHTQMNELDLPTEAQWEYACRAGTISTWYDGSNPTTNLESNAALNLLARYKTNNGGTDANSDLTSGGTTKVGSYVPNAWGLYDLYGNVSEMTLDRNAGYTYDWQTDPVGGTTSVYRIYRGGGAFDAAGNCRSTFRGTALTQTAQNGRLGFRIFFTLE